MFRTRSEDRELRALRRHVGALRRRIWLERTLTVGARALVIGLGLALIAVAVAWSRFGSPTPMLYGGPVAVALVLALAVSLFRYPSAMEAARAADHRLALRERIGTAVELAGGGSPSGGPFVRQQLGTAVEAATWARGNWRGGPGVGRELGMAAALGSLVVGIVLLMGIEERLPAPIPRPSIWSLLPSEAPVGAPADPAVEPPSATAPDRTAASPTTGPSSSIVRSLEDLRRARESGSIGGAEAASRLAQAESELNRQTEESRSQREALDRLGRALDQVAAGRPAAEQIQSGDYERAAQEIGTLGTESDQLSPQAKAQLAQGLRSAASESQASPELAAKEQRAADALAGRDYEAARRAMGDLADEVARRGDQVVPQQELAEAREAVAQERRSQGQSDGAASAQRSPGADKPSAAQKPGSASGAQSSGSGAGTDPGQGGSGDDGAAGGGENAGTASQPGSAAPSAQSVGEFQPAGQAPRLDVQGRPVEVDIKPGDRPGQRSGDPESPQADGAPNQQQSDEVGAVSAVSGDAPQRITSAAPAESNFVPNDRRQVVRDYFGGREAR
jgi:hypothetical protein